MLKIVSLTKAFHTNNCYLKEALYDKNRGYGVVTIQVNNLIFGIPLRSNISHRHGVVLDTIYHEGKAFFRGLDFTKALLIRNERAELGQPFFVSKTQKKVLIQRKKMIVNQFEKYVNQYIRAVRNEKSSTLNGPKYKYSTLVNYHSELGL